MQFPCKSHFSPITGNGLAEVGFRCYYPPKSFRDFNYFNNFNKKYAHAIGTFPPQLPTYASPFLIVIIEIIEILG